MAPGPVNRAENPRHSTVRIPLYGAFVDVFAATSAPRSDELIFQDGFGDRLLARDSEGAPSHEYLLLRGELSSVPSFEFALNERLWLVEKFDHPAYLTVRNIVRVPGRLTRIGLIHDYTNGIRLSELLARAETARQPIQLEASLFVVRDILTSLCELHRQSGDLAHGALAPERIVLADGRIRIADYVLGSAIEQLRFTTERYWKELRVAVPPTAGGARFDRHVDVAQVGMIATALFLGRRLGDSEHLGVVGDLLKRTAVPQPILSWLLKALHLDPRRVFMQANDALQGFGEAVAEAGVRPDARALDPQTTRSRTLPLPPKAARRQSPPKPSVLFSPPAPSAPPAKPVGDIAIRISPALPPLAKAAAQPKIQVQPQPVPAPKLKHHAWQGYNVDPYPNLSPRTMFSRGGVSMPLGMKRYAWGAGLAIVLLLVFAASQYMPVPEWLYTTTGTLVVESNPPGVQVFVNGTLHGVTPLTLKVESGRHEVELRGPDRPRIFHVIVARGQRVAQYVEFPPGRRR